MNETVLMGKDRVKAWNRNELPPIISCGELEALRLEPPPQVIEGLLHLGHKMMLAGTSKSNKTWCLIDLAMSVASGVPWWGRPTVRSRVLYVNLELPDWEMRRRKAELAAARPGWTGFDDSLFTWNLRGHSDDISKLRPKLQPEIEPGKYGLVVIDPVYKLLGNRDENANGDITNLLNELEQMCMHSGAALVMGHHFAKGNSSRKQPADRMCGASAWARDPDTLVLLTPHRSAGCYTAQVILRSLPPVKDFVLCWEYPTMRVRADQDPDALKRRSTPGLSMTDREFASEFLGKGPNPRGTIIAEALRQGISRPTADRYLRRLVGDKIAGRENGLYWLIKAIEPEKVCGEEGRAIQVAPAPGL